MTPRLAIAALSLCLLAHPLMAQEESAAAPEGPHITAGEGEEAEAVFEPEGEAPKTAKATAPAPEPEVKAPNAVKLQGLNKVTARISTIDAAFDTVVRFGNLEIVARRCWQSPPEDEPENAALLEIRELKPDEGTAEIFKGWMFSSSPALSAMEHPFYDITVLACEHLEAGE